jgi:hypothetical protein
MTDELKGTNPPAETPSDAPVSVPEQILPPDAPPAAQASAPQPPTSVPEEPQYDDRLERLGGEPAPVITPEEFARLQRQGQVNIDARGRVRTTRRNDAEAGVSLRKRRAWY